MTSKPGERKLERVAADSNVILSAVIGKAALRVFTETPLEVVTTSGILSEVREYLPEMARLYGLAPEVLEGQLRLLAIQEHSERAYRSEIPEARRRMEERDPDDVALLALALALDIPVWSNDNDFEVASVDWYTTDELLREFGV